jgi:predicted PurR-regulated permease PerM
MTTADVMPAATGTREPGLTTLQWRCIRMALTATACAVLAGLIAIAVWVLGEALALFKPILLPVAVGGLIALILYPLTRTLSQGLRFNDTLSIVLVLVALFGALAAGAWILAPMLVEQVNVLSRELSAWAVQLTARLETVVPAETRSLLELVTTDGDDGEAGEKVAAPVGSDRFEWRFDLPGLVSMLRAQLALLAGLAFVPLFAFFFLRSGPALARDVSDLTSVLNAQVQAELDHLLAVFVGYVAAFFQGQLIIALLMGVMYSVGFMLIGLNAGLALGVVCGLLNIVPFLGMVIALVLVLPYALMQPGDGLTLMLMALGVIVLVQVIESWYLTPRIMSDRSGLHPAVVVFSLFFWGIALGGITGVVMAVPLSAFIATLWNQVRLRYTSNLIVEHRPPPSGPLPSAPPGAARDLS